MHICGTNSSRKVLQLYQFKPGACTLSLPHTLIFFKVACRRRSPQKFPSRPLKVMLHRKRSQQFPCGISLSRTPYLWWGSNLGYDSDCQFMCEFSAVRMINHACCVQSYCTRELTCRNFQFESSLNTRDVRYFKKTLQTCYHSQRFSNGDCQKFLK